MSDPAALPVRVCLDMQFEGYMTPMELKKAASQVGGCYSTNRRLPQPVQLHVTSITGDTRAKLGVLSCGHLDSWDVRCPARIAPRVGGLSRRPAGQAHMTAQPYWEAFAPADIVYLSSESDTVLDGAGRH